MTPNELQSYLHEYIPLSAAMAVSVERVESTCIHLKAPLAPNINHRETVFGGSASAICILSAWSLLHLRLRREGLESRVVIQRNSMEYTAAVTGEFTARSFFEDVDAWPAFVKLLQRRGRARIAVGAAMEADSLEVGRLHGEFVALRMP